MVLMGQSLLMVRLVLVRVLQCLVLILVMKSYVVLFLGLAGLVGYVFNCSDIFNFIEQDETGTEFTIKCSFLGLFFWFLLMGRDL